jgi:hypothetical protein
MTPEQYAAGRVADALTKAKDEIAKCDTATRVKVINDFEAGIRYAVEYATQVLDEMLEGKITP